MNRTETETLCKNRNSCFRLRTARNTGILATTVRKKAGRLLSCASISLSETNAEEIKSSCFLPYSCSRYAGISIAHISQQRTNGVGVLFSSRRTFFHRERERDCFEQSLFRLNINAILAIFVMKIIFNQNTKCAISIKRICKPKHHLHHSNTKNMPNKTPSTPSQ